MLNAVEKLYSILVRLGSLIINVLATLKCVNVLVSRKSMLVGGGLHARYPLYKYR